jgi:hypothetical protein
MPGIRLGTLKKPSSLVETVRVGERDLSFRHGGALRISHRAGDVAGGARLGVYADKQTNTQQE